MKFTQYLFQKSEKIWEEYLNHPFIKELAEGCLPREKFQYYLIQDYLYLKEYSKSFCVGIIKASTMEEMKFFYNSIKGTMNDETEVHIKYLKNFGFEPWQVEKMESNIVNTSYTSYMLSKSLEGNIRKCAIATLPCTWSYNYIGKYIQKNYKEKLDNNFYKPWIDSYASKEFTDFTNEWLDYVDKICTDITEDEKKELLNIFITSSKYEKQFWDMVYNK